MFNIHLHNKSGIEREIESLLEQMKTMAPDSDEYTKTVKNLLVLAEATSYKKANKVSPDAFVAAAVNIAGIVMILNFEKLGIITSKALGFVSKVHV